mgnify:CR=1 FL=1
MENFDPNKTPKKQILSAQIDLSKFERATDEEKRQQDVMSESTSFFKDGMRKLFKNPLAVLSIVVLAAIILTIIIAPMIVPYGYEEILSVNGKRDKGAKNLAPFTYSKAEQKYIDEGGTRFPHIMGTDEQCRDYFIRVIYGTRISLVVGFFASIIVLIIGVTIGSIAGYCGGKVDLIIMRIVDIFNCVPTMPMMMIVGVALDKQDISGPAKLYIMMAMLTLFGWAGTARLVRGQILSLREQDFMLSAEASGLTVGRKIFRHLIPNVMPQLIVSMTLGLGGIILTEATLGDLGIGLPAEYATWGNMINAAANNTALVYYPNLWIAPGICIVLAVLAFNFVGDGLRDAFDPKARR